MIRSKLKIGYGTNERKRLFTHPIEYSHESYELNSFFDRLKPLGIEPPAIIHAPFLTIPADDQDAAVLHRAQLLVSGDSGVLHIGVGLGTPTVSLFGPGIADKWAPRGKQHAVINHKLTCSPCTRFGTTPPCLIGAKCIQDISIDEVFVVARNLLNLKPSEVGNDAV